MVVRVAAPLTLAASQDELSAGRVAQFDDQAQRRYRIDRREATLGGKLTALRVMAVSSSDACHPYPSTLPDAGMTMLHRPRWCV